MLAWEADKSAHPGMPSYIIVSQKPKLFPIITTSFSGETLLVALLKKLIVMVEEVF